MPVNQTGELPIYRRNDLALFRRAAGQAVILVHGAGELVTLSVTGAVVWELLETPQSIPALSDELAVMFAVDLDTVSRDVEALVTDLVARGILAEG